MAPLKRSNESSMKNRDKSKRRRRPNGSETLYKCLGKLCGEECEQELLHLPEDAARVTRREQKRRNNQHEIMDTDVVTDFSDEEFEAERSKQRPSAKRGRVNKHKCKKLSSGHSTELTLKLGVQKAKRYICEALEFGVESGFLTPKDPKGQVLRVSSELLQTTDPTKQRVLQRIGSGEQKPDATKRRRDAEEERDLEGDGPIIERRKHGRKRRSNSRRSHQASKRHVKNHGSKHRSRSRSKRRNGKRRMARSQSVNPDTQARTQENRSAADNEGEQEEMAENSKDTSSRIEDDNDDGKSLKSIKSGKSSPNSDSQNGNMEKKQQHADDDGSNYEGSDDEDDKKK